MKIVAVIALFCAFFLTTFATKYTGYKVYRLTPTSEENVQALAQLENYGVK